MEYCAQQEVGRMTKPHQCHGTCCVGWSYSATADSWTRSWSQAMHDYPRFELWSSACTRDGKFHGSQCHVCNRLGKTKFTTWNRLELRRSRQVKTVVQVHVRGCILLLTGFRLKSIGILASLDIRQHEFISLLHQLVDSRWNSRTCHP